MLARRVTLPTTGGLQRLVCARAVRQTRVARRACAAGFYSMQRGYSPGFSCMAAKIANANDALDGAAPSLPRVAAALARREQKACAALGWVKL